MELLGGVAQPRRASHGGKSYIPPSFFKERQPPQYRSHRLPTAAEAEPIAYPSPSPLLPRPPKPPFPPLPTGPAPFAEVKTIMFHIKD